ncbi:MAG: tetratricopeptide repeat protein, partial [Bacillota bacterium]
MTTCKICNGDISTFNCNIANSSICEDCCNKLQSGEFSNEWFQFFESNNLNFNEDSDPREINLEDDSNIFNYTLKRCLECAGCYRDQIFPFGPDPVEFKPYPQNATVSTYMNKFVFGNGFEQTAMKVAYLMERGCQSPLDYLNIANNFKIAGQYERAFQACQEGLKLGSDPQLHLMSANIRYYYFKEYDAISELLLVVRLDPTLSSAYRLLGEIHSSQNRYDEAVYYFNKARDTFDFINYRPNDAFYEFTYLGLANAYSNLGIYPKVIENSLLFLEYRHPYDEEFLKESGQSFLYAPLYHVLA